MSFLFCTSPVGHSGARDRFLRGCRGIVRGETRRRAREFDVAPLPSICMREVRAEHCAHVECPV